MKPDDAVRLATTSVDDLGVERAKSVIREFLKRLTACPACGGTRSLTVPVDLPVQVRNGTQTERISKGTAIECPVCVVVGDTSGDPAHLMWICTVELTVGECTPTGDEDHAHCGPHVVLPLDPFAAPGV